MIHKFLTAKHWQLFILLFGIPMIVQFVFMGMMVSEVINGTDSELLNIITYMKFFPILMVVFMGGFFGWLWSIGVGLQGKIPENLRLKTERFKIAFIIPSIYILAVSIAIGGMMQGFMEGDTTSYFSKMGLMLPLHLFSMFCLFYCLYFAAKTMKVAEVQREVKFNDFIENFFLIWFYPIGVWILQPRINKLMETHQEVQ